MEMGVGWVDLILLLVKGSEGGWRKRWMGMSVMRVSIWLLVSQTSPS